MQDFNWLSVASLRSTFSDVIPPLAQGITGNVVVDYPCNTLNSTKIAGKIVISAIQAGNCLYWTQAQNVKAAGGKAVILWKNQPTYLAMLYTTTTSNGGIVCISIGSTLANSIIAATINGTVSITIGYTPTSAPEKQVCAHQTCDGNC